ncbi:hypothetical protein K9L67_02170 [Candidatus Woesearchaeota archaeon]|nr:hypothetical protein [Candidatus Woesearchaeota archaeon]MCF7901010.1 hypothetical protein [Candidatus Woesearchaeota archaeon]MCF8013274.1 hypothetical protein [Candidatus Woesearchaeota archaeon]
MTEIYTGALITPILLSAIEAFIYKSDNNNNFEVAANEIKENTIKKTKELNPYLSQNINPEEYFRKGTY